MTAGNGAWGQQYVISTVAGGAPVPTPITATNAAVGNVTNITAGPGGDVFFSGCSSQNCYSGKSRKRRR